MTYLNEHVYDVLEYIIRMSRLNATVEKDGLKKFEVCIDKRSIEDLEDFLVQEGENCKQVRDVIEQIILIGKLQYKPRQENYNKNVFVLHFYEYDLDRLRNYLKTEYQKYR